MSRPSAFLVLAAAAAAGMARPAAGAAFPIGGRLPDETEVKTVGVFQDVIRNGTLKHGALVSHRPNPPLLLAAYALWHIRRVVQFATALAGLTICPDGYASCTAVVCALARSALSSSARLPLSTHPPVVVPARTGVGKLTRWRVGFTASLADETER